MSALTRVSCLAPRPVAAVGTGSRAQTVARAPYVGGGAFDPRPARGPTAFRAQADVEASTSEPTIVDRLDEKACLEEIGFAIAPDKLIELTERFLATNLGTEEPSLLAEEFQLKAPIITLPNKDLYVSIVGQFAFTEAFPDAKENFHGFTVDPISGNRVWFISRFRGTHDGKEFAGIQPSGKKVDMVPTMNSVTFNEEGKITKFTTGYPIDKDEGNTGGLSLAFGIVYALDPDKIKIPEAQPYKSSWQFKILTWLGRNVSKRMGVGQGGLNLKSDVPGAGK